MALAVLVAVVFGGDVAPPDARTPSELPFVELSESSPAAVHHSDGSWTIPVVAPASVRGGDKRQQPVGVCKGSAIDPEIVARSPGTAVHFATKYFCTGVVQWTIRTGVTNWYDETIDGPVLPHPGGETVAHGVGQQAYAEGFSPPCRTNQNSGWEPWDESQFGNGHAKHSGKRITVGCRM